MPSALPRACPVMGCASHVPCQTHQPARLTGRRSAVSQQRYDEQRGSSTARGYDSRWRKARVYYLQKHPLCRPCQAKGQLTVATIVDHIIPHKGDRQLFWDSANNWQPICKPCHDLKTWKEARQAMSTSTRTVVCGPPGSGKTTWVRQHAKPGDIVFDFDDIASAVGYAGQPLSRDNQKRLPFAVAQATLAMREGLLTWLAATPLHEANTYVIVSDASEAERIAERLGARLVPFGQGAL